jgi:hypothetical protein
MSLAYSIASHPYCHNVSQWNIVVATGMNDKRFAYWKAVRIQCIGDLVKCQQTGEAPGEGTEPTERISPVGRVPSPGAMSPKIIEFVQQKSVRQS